MGIGLRDPIVGPFLRIHLAGDGRQRFYRKLFSIIPLSMGDHGNLDLRSPFRAENCNGVKGMEMVRSESWKKIKMERRNVSQLLNVLAVNPVRKGRAFDPAP